MGEPYAEWEKPGSKGYIYIVGFPLYDVLDKTIGQKTDQSLPGWGQGKELTAVVYEGTLWGEGTVLYLDCGSSYMTGCIRHKTQNEYNTQRPAFPIHSVTPQSPQQWLLHLKPPQSQGRYPFPNIPTSPRLSVSFARWKLKLELIIHFPLKDQKE